MKLLGTGDWHLTDKVPENRVDDYNVAQYRKVKFILKMAKLKECEAILQPGDFWDSWRVSDALKRKYIKLFKEYGIRIITVPGQHDLRYHNSDIENTPLGVLEAAEVICIVDKPFYLKDDNKNVIIYPAGWEQEIPDLINDDEAYHILLTHRMIIKDEKIWYGQEDFDIAEQLIKKSGFDLVVSGDNHQSFLYSDKRNKTSLINCGSLMRARTDQLHHDPVLYIIDTDKRTLEKQFITTKPAEDVLLLDLAEKSKERNAELESFVEQLSSDIDIKGLSFMKNMIAYLRKNKINTDVAKIIEKTLN